MQAQPLDLSIPQALGLALEQRAAGQLAYSASICENILTVDHDHVGALLLLGSLCQQAGQLKDAVPFLQRAARLDPKRGETHTMVVHTLLQMNQNRQAQTYCAWALKQLPRQAQLWEYLGDMWGIREKHKKAHSCYQRAVHLDPLRPKARNNLGCALRALERVDEAEHHLRRAIELNPNLLAAHVSLIDTLEMKHRPQEALEAAQSALALHPGNPNLVMLAAKCRRRLGDIQGAIDDLEGLDFKDCQLKLLTQVYTLLGKLYDKQGRSEQAFEHFNLANQKAMEVNPQWDKDRRSSQADQGVRARAFQMPQIASWQPPAMDTHEPCPVLLLGFPRSGTTLMEQVLYSHSGITTLDERNPFNRVMTETGATSPEQYRKHLRTMTPQKARYLRGLYWQQAAKYVDLEPGQILVDKMPLYLNVAGFIWQTFPKAKFILALRHPLDAVLSCYMQYFYHNRAMANCYRLQDIVDLYCGAMGLWLMYSQKLPLTVHTVKYEDLVQDFEPEARAMIKFTGLDWEPGINHFDRKARERNLIRTPSYDQVTQGIYQDAAYRYQRYLDHLAPYIPRLMPYIEKFGYSVDPLK